MTNEEKEKFYYNIKSKDYLALPDSMDAKDFFSLDFLNYLIHETEAVLLPGDVLSVISIFHDNSEYMDILIPWICSIDGGECFNGISIKKFNSVMGNESIREDFLRFFVKYVNGTNARIYGKSMRIILLNVDILRDLSRENITNIEVLNHFISAYLDYHHPSDPTPLLTMLQTSSLFLEIFLNRNKTDFFSIIESFHLEEVLHELIQKKLEMLSKEEILDLLEKMESKKPIYLQNLYRQYEVQLRQNKLLKQISFLNENSSTDEKEALKQIITQNEEYLDIFLSQTTEDTFQKVLSILNLSDEYKSLRKDRLFEKLSTYQQYDLDSVKDLFSLYCFQDIYFNVKLRLKTFLGYAKRCERIKERYPEELFIAEKIYQFFTCNEWNTDLMPLIADGLSLPLNSIIQQIHQIFSDEVNQKTDIFPLLKERIPSIESFQGEDIPVFLLDDLPADQALFLVHSVSKSDLDRDVRNKKVTSNRICMSILDDRHSKTFLDGIVFGFCNMAVPLYSATSFDGQTGQWYYNDSRPVYRSTLTSVDDFMEHTFSEYNELCYFTNGQYQTPSYVLVINREPSDSDYQVASSLHIPIVIYHTKDKDHETVTSENNDDDFLSEWFDYMKKTFPLLPANPEKKEIEVLS